MRAVYYGAPYAMMSDHEERVRDRGCEECGGEVALRERETESYDERGRYRPRLVLVVECLDCGHQERRLC